MNREQANALFQYVDAAIDAKLQSDSLTESIRAAEMWDDLLQAFEVN